MGHDTRTITPHDTRDHTWDDNPPAPSALVSPSEFWDNITIPYSTYFPAPHDGLPDHQTPPPAAYAPERGAPPVWDQPVQNQEYSLEPVRTVEEPIAGPSTAPQCPPRSRNKQSVGQQSSSLP